MEVTSQVTHEACTECGSKSAVRVVLGAGAVRIGRAHYLEFHLCKACAEVLNRAMPPAISQAIRGGHGFKIQNPSKP